MISSVKEYDVEMRKMLLKVQNGYEPPFEADIEELELFADCIRKGYLLGKVSYVDRDGVEQELRTMDGKMHPELSNHIVTPAGLAFLNPEKEDRRPMLALVVSIVALLVSILSNLDKILSNLHFLLSFFQ